jgi:hypothetical protein
MYPEVEVKTLREASYQRKTFKLKNCLAGKRPMNNNTVKVFIQSDLLQAMHIKAHLCLLWQCDPEALYGGCEVSGDWRRRNKALPHRFVPSKSDINAKGSALP